MLTNLTKNGYAKEYNNMTGRDTGSLLLIGDTDD
jgi:hypothetical protein